MPIEVILAALKLASEVVALAAQVEKRIPDTNIVEFWNRHDRTMSWIQNLIHMPSNPTSINLITNPPVINNK